MGLFDRFKKPKETHAPAGAGSAQQSNPEALLEIARMISDGDEAVLCGMKRCIDGPAGYFAEHESFMERGLDGSEAPEDIQWLALVDLLEEQGHVCERDWKDEKEDFLYFLQSRSGMKRLGLEIQPGWLKEDGDISEWCGVIAGKWAGRECRVAAIDIDSDSYVLFPCRNEDLERLSALAEQLGRNIDAVGKM